MPEKVNVHGFIDKELGNYQPYCIDKNKEWVESKLSAGYKHIPDGSKSIR